MLWCSCADAATQTLKTRFLIYNFPLLVSIEINMAWIDSLLHGMYCFPYSVVPAGSPSRGWDVVVYVFDIDQPTLPTPFYSVPVSVSVLWRFQLYSIP